MTLAELYDVVNRMMSGGLNPEVEITGSIEDDDRHVVHRGRLLAIIQARNDHPE
jgi:hypothetical protein